MLKIPSIPTDCISKGGDLMSVRAIEEIHHLQIIRNLNHKKSNLYAVRQEIKHGP